MKFDNQLHSILTRENFNSFTVSEAMAEYAQANCEAAPVDRNWMYCQLRRLTNKGMLEKERQASLNRVIYKKTELFDANVLQPQVSAQDLTAELAPKTITDERFLELITERANSVKVELLSGISEGQEYKALIEEFPALRPNLEDKYQQACLQSTSPDIAA